MANNPFIILIMQRAQKGLLVLMLLLTSFWPDTVHANTAFDSSWLGRYTWINPTTKTNQGKIEQYSLILTEAAPDRDYPFELHLPSDSETFCLFPLLPAQVPPGKWVAWERGEVWARAYRENATIFNTTVITPAAWRLKEQRFQTNCFYTSITTRVMLMNFTCDNTIELVRLPEGEKALLFSLTSSGLAAWGTFKNPKPSSMESATSFLLRQVK